MHSDLEFKVVKPEPDVTTGVVCCAVIFIRLGSNFIDLEEGLSQTESNQLASFFKEKVAVAPYHREHIVSFIFLLTLPINVLKEFIKIINLEKVTDAILVTKCASIATSSKVSFIC
jgi:hypothetical protein